MARGFISMGLILVLIIAAAILGGSAYYANNQSLVFRPIIPVTTTASTTPPNPILCQAGQHSNGVTCVPDSTTPNPPKPITCPTGQHSNGTECVGKDGNACPIYNACPPGYTSNTSVDANGCTKLACTAPTNTPFSATPTSGRAPLTVSFSSLGLAGGQSYTIGYGDGSSSGQLTAPACENVYGCPVTASHTYTAAGTYAATLSQHIGGPSGPEQLVGTVTITVTR